MSRASCLYERAKHVGYVIRQRWATLRARMAARGWAQPLAAVRRSVGKALRRGRQVAAAGLNWVRRFVGQAGGDTSPALARFAGPSAGPSWLEAMEPRLYLSSIAGRVFADADDDGVRDGGEVGIAGWQVYLDQNQNGQFDSGETDADDPTDGDGDYLFSGLSAGTYYVRATPATAPGWDQTTPASGAAHTVTLGSSQDEVDRDIGFHYERAIDDGDSDFSLTGSWLSYGDGNAYQSDYRTKVNGDGSAKAAWRFEGLADGYYEAFATWSVYSYNAINAAFSVLDDDDPQGGVTLNQRISPDDVSHASRYWESLGTYPIDSGELVVELSDLNDGTYAQADGVYVVQRGAMPATGAGDAIIDDGEIGYSQSGTWNAWGDANAFSTDVRAKAVGSGSAEASWRFTQLTGSYYEVYATWSAASYYSVAAPFSVLDDSTVVGQVQVNQEVAPNDLTHAGRAWESLGVYQIESDELVVELSDGGGGSGYVQADAIYIVERTSIPATGAGDGIIDDGEVGYSQTGTWSAWTEADAFNLDVRAKPVGNGSAKASWRFTQLEDSTYEVYATWAADSFYTVAADFSVLDGATVVGQLQVNQEVAPNDLTHAGRGWESLGVYDIDTGELVVELSDATNGASAYVQADAIYIVERPSIPPTGAGDGIIDDGEVGYGQAGTWSAWTNANAFSSDHRAKALGDGSATATWQFTQLEGGYYEAFATWPAGSFYTVAAEFSVLEESTLKGHVTLNQQIAPDDLSQAGKYWESLGVYDIAAGGALTVQLSDATGGAAGWVQGDAVHLVQRPAIPSTGAGDGIIDDGEVGYSQTGSWYAWTNGNTHSVDVRTKYAGTGSAKATWRFDQLADGYYEAFATWAADYYNTTAAPFSVLDGNTAETTVQLNQSIAPNDITYASRSWESLGVFHIDNGELVVELSDSAAYGFVQADAIYVAPATDTLVEGSDFHTDLQQTFTLPEGMSALSLDYHELDFDTADTSGMNDAFELALVDAAGRPLVATLGFGRDAFFNFTEGQMPQVAGSALYEANGDDGGQLTIDVSHLPAGTELTLIARLINNDSDTDTQVTIDTGFFLYQGSPVIEATTATPTAATGSTAATIDFNLLTDITGALGVDYGRTFFDEDTHQLAAELSLTLQRPFAVTDTLLVGVKNLSDLGGNPGVRVDRPDGYTPDGVPYFNISALAFDDENPALELEDTVDGVTLRFFNPDRVQFTYDLVVLGHVNLAPSITSAPDEEAVAGADYAYQVAASDPEQGGLSYAFVSAPDGMMIDSDTGLIEWEPGSGDVGRHPVVVRVTDPYGAMAQHDYALAVVDGVPNRPPLVTSIPVVDAYVGELYVYLALAEDADGDAVTFTGELVGIEDEDFSVTSGGGGLVQWTPDADLIGQIVTISLTADDGGDEAEQVYQVRVLEQSGNHAPIITSSPVLTAVPRKAYEYQVEALDGDADEPAFALEEGAPAGMTIHAETGLITWAVPIIATGTEEVEVVVTDGRGGVARQAFEIAVNTTAGSVSGTVFLDFAGNGVQDDELPTLPPGPLDVHETGSFVEYTSERTPLTVFGGSGNTGVNASPGYMSYQLYGGGVSSLIAPMLRSEDSSTHDLEWVSVLSDGNGPDDDDVLGGFGVAEYESEGIAHSVATVEGVTVHAYTELIGTIARTTFTFAASDLDGKTFIFFAENDLGGSGSTDYVDYSGSVGGGDLVLKQIDTSSGGFTVQISGSTDAGADLTLFGSGARSGFGEDLAAGDLSVLSDDGSNLVDATDIGIAMAYELTGATATVVIDYRVEDSPIGNTYVYVDYDEDGVRDMDDPGTSSVDESEPYTLTNARGEYTIGNVLPGWQIIRVDGAFEPYLQTSSGLAYIEGGSPADVDVAVQRRIGSIHGRAFEDFNGDGEASAGEPGLPGVDVYLDLDRDGAWDGGEPIVTTMEDDAATTTVDEAGSYVFESVPTGSYVVRQVTPEDYELTTPSDVAGVATIDFSEVATAKNVSSRYQGGYGVTFGYYFDGQRWAEEEEITNDAYQYGVVLDDPSTPLDIQQNWWATEWDVPGYFIGPYIIPGSQVPSSTAPHLVTDPETVLGGIESIWNTGAVAILFDSPVAWASLRVTSLNNADSVYVTAYDEDGDVIDEVTVGYDAPQTDAVVQFGDADEEPLAIKGILLHYADPEYRGFGVDDLQFPAIGAAAPGGGGHIVFVDGIHPSTIDAAVAEDVNFGNKPVEPPTHAAPEFLTAPPTAAVLDHVYRYDADTGVFYGIPAVYDLVVAPTGMAINEATGVIVWRPDADQAGEHEVILRATDQLGGVTLQPFSILARLANEAPVIVSKPPSPAAAEIEYTYAVSATDVNGDLVSYRLLQHPSGMTIDADTGLIEWTPGAAPGSAGDYRVQIEASDLRRGIATQTFTLTVASTAPPRFSSEPTLLAFKNQEWTYDLTGFDPDGGSVTFSLDALSEARGMSIDGSNELSWTPIRAGTYNLTITATDNESETLTQRFTLTVETEPAVNVAPAITSIPTGPAAADRAWQYQVQASDANHDVLAFSLDEDALSLGMTIDEDTGLIEWTPEAGGIFMATVTATDGDEASGSQTFTLVVLDNAPPVITSLPIKVAELEEAYSYTVDVDDPNTGGTLTYTLLEGPAWLTIGSSSGVLSGTPEETEELGVWRVTVAVTDDAGDESRQFFQLLVVDPNDTHAPVIEESARRYAQVGQRMIRQVVAGDADGDALTYSLISGPTGLRMDDRGLVTWTPGSSQVTAPGTPATYTVEVSDGTNSDQHTFEVDVQALFINASPQITSSPNTIVTAGSTYWFSPAATDADGDEITWLVDGIPATVAGVANGLFQWAASPADVGTHTVELTAIDAYGASTTQTLTLTVRGVNLPPMIRSTPPTRAIEDAAYTYTMQAMDPEGGPLHYSLVNSPPAGADIDPDTGVLTWTAGEPDDYTFTIEVTDDAGASVRQTYKLVVVSSATNQLPTIDTVPPQYFAFVGQPWEYEIESDDAEGSVTLTVDGPAGMDFDMGNAELLEWTPDGGDVGQHLVTVTSTDGSSAAVHQSFTVTVLDNDPPAIADPGSVTVAAGGVLRFAVDADDPDNDFLFYSLDATSLSRGITIDAVGQIFWATDGDDIDETPYEIVVTVTDAYGQEASDSLFVTVEEDETDPVVLLQASALEGYVGDVVTFYISATDNVAATRFALDVDGFNVPLSAAPGGAQGTYTLTSTGTLEVTARVYDAAGNYGEDELTLDGLAGNADAPDVLLLSPGENDTVTELIDIVGTVTDGDDDLVSYSLSLLSDDGGLAIPLFTVGSALDHADPVTNDVLGQLDPTLLPNGSFFLRLTAVDELDNESIYEQPITLNGRLKLGNFRLSFTDLSLSLSGVPITVSRTYDTLNANSVGDFGHGWGLDVLGLTLNADIGHTSDHDTQAIGLSSPFFHGTRLHITLPDGTRESFTFAPIPLEDRGIEGYAAGLLYLYGGLSKPSFIPAPGTTSSLAFDQNTHLFRDIDTGDYTTSGGLPFNPASPLIDLNYILTTKDGTKFTLSGDTGRLINIADRNGNTLTVTDAGVVSRNADGNTIAQIEFERDYLGRIVSVADLAGQKIHYTYDILGDLVAVTDRADAATTFIYDPEISGGRDHFLTGIVDARGVTVLETTFNETTGRLDSLTDASGAEIPFTYDLNLEPGQHRETLADAFDVVTELVRDSRGNVIRRVQQAELEPNETPSLRKYVVTVYTYDGRDNQTAESLPFEVTGDDNKYTAEPTGWQSRREVNESGDVLSETDALGHVTRYTYDRYGNVLTTTDALGNTTRNEYDDLLGGGNLIATIDAAGQRTTFSYAGGNLIGVTNAAGQVVSTFTYNAQGRILTGTPTGGLTTYFEYDDNGKPTRAFYTVTEGEDEVTVISETEYDDAGRVIATRQIRSVDEVETVLYSTATTYTPTGQVKTATDIFGRNSENHYNSRGLLTMTRSQTRDENDNEQWLVTLNVYDANGRSIFATDSYIEGTADPIFATQYISDALGRVVETSRREDVDVTVTVDGDVVETSVDEGDEGEELWSAATEYDAASRVIVAISPTDATTEYVYDDNSQLLEATTDIDGNPATTGDRATTTYAYDPVGRQTSVTDALEHTTRFIYDAIGRLTSTIYADGTTTSTGYDAVGRRISETDQLGRTTNYEHEAAGHLTAVELPAVFDADPESPTYEDTVGPRYEYGYDDRGNMTTITDPKGRVTTFAFDAFNRQVGRELPLDQTESMVYNDFGQVELAIDFEDRHTQYIYNDVDRLSEKHYFVDAEAFDDGEGTPDRSVEYVYDAFGRVLTIDDSVDGLTNYAYDTQGQLTQVDRSAATDESILNYAYNDLNQLTHTWTSTDIAGEYRITETAYAYDALARLETVTQTWRDGTDITDEATTYVYDLAGNLDKIVNANGVVADYDHDALYRVIQLTHFKDDDEDLALDEGEDIVALFEYHLDAGGNCIGAVEAFDGDNDGDLDSPHVFAWEYDNLNRLSREVFDSENNALDYNTTYSFDLSSNRMLAVTIDASGTETVGYTYDDNDRLMEEESSVSGVTTYTYNLAGDQTSKSAPGMDTVNYRYDVMGRMVGVDTNDDDIDDVIYIYDSNGIRVAHTATGDTRTYVYDIQNPTGYAKPIEEYVDNELKRSYAIGYMIHEQWNATDGVIVLLLDVHGSTRALLDATGDIVESYSYQAFGEAIGFDRATALTSWQFAGDGSYDAASDLTYHLARWREDQRFISTDPYAGNLLDPVSLHKSLYANANPQMYVDPLGRMSFIEKLATVSIKTVLLSSIVAVGINAVRNHANGLVWYANWYEAAIIGAYIPYLVAAAPFAIPFLVAWGLVDSANVLDDALDPRNGRTWDEKLAAATYAVTALYLGGRGLASEQGQAGVQQARGFVEPWVQNAVRSMRSLLAEQRPTLPAFTAGGKTSGILRTLTGDVPLLSGKPGPAASLPKPSPGFNAITSTHVEGHAAALMRQQGILEATLYINNPRICVPCLQNIEHMLPPGSRLTIVLPDGSTVTYVGNAR